MTSPIERFLQQVRAAESRNQREIVMPLMQARDLHADITRLLLKLEAKPVTESVVTVEMRGSDF
jgi:hypothetical protein